MVLINKAILHILDLNSNVTVFSEQELDIKKNSVDSFLTKHVEKAFTDPKAKTGTFNPQSGFKTQMLRYLGNGMSFVDFSRYIADLTYAVLAKSDALDSADILVCDVNMDNERVIGILKCNNRVGYIHQVINESDGIKNDIINHYAIMPNLSQKIDEYAFIGTESLNIKLVDKKSCVDGQETYIFAEKIIECNTSVSPKKTIELVSAITGKVAEAHGQSGVAVISKAKNYIMENAEISESIDPVALGRDIFGASVIMQEAFMKEIQDAGVSETVKVDKTFAVRKVKNHKIKTDTGIEVIFPVDYFDNKDFLEFVNNPDGTISIELKNIGKIVNKA